MKKWILTMCCVLLLAVVSCRVSVDPISGEKQQYIDPNTATAFEEGAEGAAGILTALAPFIPELGVFSLILTGALGIWRKKWKEKLTTAQTKTELLGNAGEAAAHFADELKKILAKTVPDTLAELKELYKNAYGSEIGAVIHGWQRGTGPKT